MLMKMSKKTIFLSALLLVLTMALVLSGCSNESTEPDEGSEPVENGTPDEGNAETSYPERNIEVLVGWGAGGGTDTFARQITMPAAEDLGVSLTVVNHPGASGSIAGDLAANADSDGYTLWAISSNYPLNVALGKTPHELDKYIPVCRVQADTATIQTLGEGDYNTIDKLVEAAKANPGQINLGGTGALGFDDIVVAMWEKEAGIEFNYVPFENAGEMHAALLGGHIDAMFEEFGPTIGLLEEGRINAVLAFTEEKLEDFPDVPVSGEMGWEVYEGQSRGILAPADTPQEVIDVLVEAFKSASESEEYKKYEKDSMLHLRKGWLDSEGFSENLNNAIETYKQVLEDIQ